MTTNDRNDVAAISAITGFVERQSDIENNRFVFAYTITIENISSIPFQLISRHWLILDANKKAEEVFGEGVVGEQPVIQPGDSFTYTSGAVLETEIGTMEGRYFLRDETGDEFSVVIPRFVLSVPRTLH
jgi:ApaG protein